MRRHHRIQPHFGKLLIAMIVSTIAVALLWAGAVAWAATDDDVPGTAIALGERAEGIVNPASDPNDVYGVWLDAGEEVRLKCLPTATSSSADPKEGGLWLLSPEASSLGAADDHTIAHYANLWKGSFLTTYAEFELVAARSGTYYAWVEGTAGNFAYTLDLQSTGRPSYPASDANDIPGLPQGLGTVRGVVDTRVDSNDVYAVKLLAGQEVTVTLEPTHEVADGEDKHLTGTAWLYLLSPESTSVSSYSTRHEVTASVAAFNSRSDDRDETAVISYVPSATAVHYIWVRASSVVTNFAYTLTISGSAALPDDTPPPGTQTFPDVPSAHAYFTAIEGMADAGIIGGYADGRFGPFDPLYRAQFAKMICGTFNLSTPEGTTLFFTDLGEDDPSSLYPHQYVAAAYTAGITQGLTATTFGTYVDITRAQVITMSIRAAERLAPEALAEPPAGFDCTVPNFSDVHYPNLRKAEYNGLLEGLIGFGESWDPWQKASRGECAQILWNLLGKLSAD